LRYNDYGGEGDGAKSDGIYDLMAALRRKGTPVHGVGLQMHASLKDAPPAPEVRINMLRLAALGLQTHITEMDVMLPLPASRAELRAQAALYRGMLQACLAVLQCRSFFHLGRDRPLFVDNGFPRPGRSAAFPTDGRAKPAYDSVRRTCAPRRQGAELRCAGKRRNMGQVA
jgi:endo-1,4-beta-xylanase